MEVTPVELLAAKGQVGVGSWVTSGQDQGCEEIPRGSLCHGWAQLCHSSPDKPRGSGLLHGV